MLAYTETTTKVITTTKVLTLPSEWGCFTSETNRSIMKKAETLLKRAKEIQAIDHRLGERAKPLKSACISFVAGWERMTQNPRHRKAGVADTDVREQVFSFMEKVCKCLGYENSADGWWEEGREKGWKLRNQ